MIGDTEKTVHSANSDQNLNESSECSIAIHEKWMNTQPYISAVVLYYDDNVSENGHFIIKKWISKLIITN